MRPIAKIESMMKEKEMNPLSHAVLYPLSLIYSAAVRLRYVLYRTKALPTKTLPCTVISIGNITVGGTGKTPVAIHIAAYLRDSGKRVAVLSRGYKRSSKGICVVSDGKEVLMTPIEAGDEPYLMALRLPGVPVIVGPDRVKSGEFALRQFSPNVIILDDVYQHIRLGRDINILLLDSEAGFGNGYLLPRGILREPLSALKRADVALVKGGKPGGAEARSLLEHSIPLVPFSYRPTHFCRLSGGAKEPAESLRGRGVAAVAGLANPSSFLSTLKGLGANVVKTFLFPDHHAYSKKDIEEITRASGAALIVTTEKDGVKLKALSEGLEIYALAVDVEMDPEMFRNYLGPLLKGVF